jgi:predicted transcriptional regulator
MKSLSEKLESEQCRRILVELKSCDRSPDELVKLTKLTLGSVNKHVAVLVEANLVWLNTEGIASIKR